MSGLEQKQMLCISVQDHNSDPHLIFEIEPYYSRKTRRIFMERAPENYNIDCFDNQTCLDNLAFVWDVGYALILGLLVYEQPGDYEAQIVYPHHRCGNPVLRIDEEPYEYKRHRKFCAAMPLPTLDMDEGTGNNTLLFKTGKTVLEHLPLIGFQIETPEKT